MSLQNIIKIFQTIKKLRHAQEFGLEICSGEVTRRRPKEELSFLHAIILLQVILLSNYLKQYGSYGLQKKLASGDIST